MLREPLRRLNVYSMDLFFIFICMAKKLYVGNLPYSVTDEQLGQMFAQFGQVSSAVVIKFKDTGRSKGFGFVEMSTDEEAQKAIQELNGKEVGGRNIVVNEARPREERPSGFGGSSGGFRDRGPRRR